jgi:hypothetical protein
VAASGWRAWPPRLPDQPIFYPVCNRWYATKITREWNVPAEGVGYVTRFEVDRAYLDRYEVHQAGGRDVLEYWIPAAELAELNAHIVGAIIGGDGSREQLVLDLRGDPAPVLLLDTTSDGWANGIRQGDDIGGLIDRIEAGTFAFTFADGEPQPAVQE